MTSNELTPSTRADQNGWVGVLQSLHRYLRLILTLAIGLPLVAAVVLLFVPNKYTGKGTILVETPENSLGLDPVGQLSALTGIPSGGSSAEVYLSILSSESVALAVIDSLDLVNYYDASGKSQEYRRERALHKLRKRLTFDRPDFVTIAVRGKDEDPAMAAALVNAAMNQLENSSQNLAFTRATKTRKLVEEVLGETELDLEAARARLEEFQRKHGVVNLENQVATTMALIGELQGVLMQTRARRDALLAYQQGDSGQLRKLNLEIAALEEQIQQLMGVVSPETEEEEAEDYLLEMGDLPKVGGAYARLMLDMTVLETKYSVLAARLEQTKIDESQSVPAFEILDWARVPQAKSWPNRRLLVMLTFAGSLLGACFLAVLMDDINKRLSPDSREYLLVFLPAAIRKRLADR